MFKILKKINKSASYAIAGLKGTFKEEFMMRVQFTFGLIQFILALILGFSLEQTVIIFVIWVVLVSQENMNTAVENLTDLVSPQEQKLAKRAKDSAGGAVFIISVMSWIVFGIFLIAKFIN
ncbi:MAG: diacylglycerol kinase family protein [Mycoplasmatales bacterium]